MKNLIIVLPCESVLLRPRANKVAGVYNRLGYKIKHFAWMRGLERDHGDNSFNISTKVILKGGGDSKRINLFYVQWFLKLFWHSFFIRKNTVVWAIGFESAFPFLLASKVRKFKLVFDDADRLSMVIALPRPAQKLLRCLEYSLSSLSNAHVVPNVARYSKLTKKMIEIKNVPTYQQLAEAKSKKITVFERFPGVSVYVNGLLLGSRGIATLNKMFDQYDCSEVVRFIVCGTPRDDAAIKFLQRDGVLNLGSVDQIAALAYYKQCDFVFTYYDPVMTVNRYAESNKWGDAIAMGCRVIVNGEVVTAKPLIDAGLAVSFYYNDFHALYNFFVKEKAVSLAGKSIPMHNLECNFLAPYQRDFEKSIKAVQRSI